MSVPVSEDDIRAGGVKLNTSAQSQKILVGF